MIEKNKIILEEVKIQRLQRRIAKRDEKIKAMELRISLLERALATRTLDLESLSKNLENVVQRALCNVRMIPVFDAGKKSRVITEVRNTSEND